MSVYQTECADELRTLERQNRFNVSDEDTLMDVSDIHINDVDSGSVCSNVINQCSLQSSTSSSTVASHAEHNTHYPRNPDCESMSTESPKGQSSTSSVLDDVYRDNTLDDEDRGTSFGKGWWKSPALVHEHNSSVSSSDRGNSSLCDSVRRNSSVSHSCRRNSSVSLSDKTDNGEDFGAGWWKSNSSEDSRTSKYGRNKKRNTSAPPNGNRKRAKNCSSDSSEFGCGWWVGRLDKPQSSKKYHSQSTNSKHGSSIHSPTSTNDILSSRIKSNSCKKKAQSNECVENTVLDIVPYKPFANPGKHCFA